MSKVNPLAGLIGNYGDSDEDSDDGSRPMSVASEVRNNTMQQASAAVHPAPIPHCPWSACYDETSGFTYYWNQQTNAVTWEAPPEYLLALKLAQQQLHTAGSAEVSAEEWQLYQQALAEKQNSQNKVAAKAAIIKATKKNEKPPVPNKNSKFNKKRHYSDDEDEKIELITSYYNSDSESNDEAESPVKPLANKTPAPPLPQKPVYKPNPPKKPKTRPQVEYGPPLPPKQNYTFPIGPELPPEFVDNSAISPKAKVQNEVAVKDDIRPTKQNDIDDNQDETTLFLKLKDKARLLEKLGGEIPKELQKMIEDGTKSGSATPRTDETKILSDNIDDLLEEIEKKELPKVSKTKKTVVFDNDVKMRDDVLSPKLSPKSDRGSTPPIEAKPLFPSIQNIDETKAPSPKAASPKVTDIDEDKKPEVSEKKGVNLYLADVNEHIEKVSKKKLRISNSVLPERKKNEEPAYTTKYSQFIEGFSSERTGLGFSKEEDDVEGPKNTISYGNGLTFTKGETLNEDKKDEDLDDLTELVEAKLNYLNQLQPCQVPPVQEMLIQMQTLVSAFRAGALSPAHWRRWALGAARSLRAHEAGAAPPGWTCAFQSLPSITKTKLSQKIHKLPTLFESDLIWTCDKMSEGRYCYRREADGLVQWEYPAVASTDMDISTTPPHPGIEGKEDPLPPPPPPAAAAPRTPSPVGAGPGAGAGAGSPAPPRVRTPPPPSWFDPPPPGCDDLPPLPPPEAKQEIGDELASFYSDIAELEKQTPDPHTASNSPEPQEYKETHREQTRTAGEKEREKDKDRDKVNKKKSKVKISTSMGLKHKSVSNLVAKWQQVADEIHSD